MTSHARNGGPRSNSEPNPIARRAGAPRPDVKALLDHVNGDVTEVYDKYDMLKEKRQVEDLLASELRRIVGDGPVVAGTSGRRAAA